MASDRVQRTIENLLDEAEQAVGRSDWDSVKDRAQNALAFDPDNQDAAFFLAAADRAMNGSATPTTSSSSTQSSHSTPAQPTSFSNGRYEVKRFLGEGGKKMVYLANDTTLDREVAFALIKTEGLNAPKRFPHPLKGSRHEVYPLAKGRPLPAQLL